MEEPEIALPPHIQKRVVLSVVEKSTQALFTSHSPYVLEEFEANQILVVSREKGIMSVSCAGMPPNVKAKGYQEELRKRFCETLLARRVLIVEGRTELDVYSAAARKLQKLHPDKHISFETLGISPINAESDSKIPPLGEYYRGMNKKVYAIFDKQDEHSSEKIKSSVDHAFEATEHGIENVVLKGVNSSVLRKFALKLVLDGDWPPHLKHCIPNDGMTDDAIYDALFAYMTGKKGDGALARLVIFCDEGEMPTFIRDTIYSIAETVNSSAISLLDEKNASCEDDI